jgi:hypothetical protein
VAVSPCSLPACTPSPLPVPSTEQQHNQCTERGKRDNGEGGGTTHTRSTHQPTTSATPSHTCHTQLCQPQHGTKQPERFKGHVSLSL